MDRIDWCVLGFTAAILVFLVFVPPPVGLANNGDFGKLIARFNLGAPFEYEFRYATTKYNYDSKYWYSSGIYSSELVLVYAALGLNALIFHDGAVDIRCIGAVHSALFLLAVYLLLPLLHGLKTGVRIALLAVLGLVFMDVMYLALFNSYYMDTGAFLFLELAVVLFLRAWRKPSIGAAVACVLCCVLLITSKAQHCFLALPMVLFVLWKGGSLWPGRALVFKAVTAMALLGAAAFTWLVVPPEYDVAPLYTMIFTGILNTSSDVSGELAAVGLDDSYARWADTTGFSIGNPLSNPDTLKQFTDRTSYRRLGYFFLTHPLRTYQITVRALGEAGRQRPMLGNFDRSAGKPDKAETEIFAVWSGIKRALFFHRGDLYLLYFLVLATAAIWVSFTPATFLLISMALLEMGVACLGDAADAIRHCFFFNALLDMILVATIAAYSSRSTSSGLRPKIL